MKDYVIEAFLFGVLMGCLLSFGLTMLYVGLVVM